MSDSWCISEILSAFQKFTLQSWLSQNICIFKIFGTLQKLFMHFAFLASDFLSLLRCFYSWVTICKHSKKFLNSRSKLDEIFLSIFHSQVFIFLNFPVNFSIIFSKWRSICNENIPYKLMKFEKSSPHETLF